MTVYGFNQRRASTLNRVADREGLAPRMRGATVGYGRPLPDTAGMLLAKVPPTGIPARTLLSPGQATCEVWKLNSGGEIEYAGFTAEILNIYPVAVAFDAATPYFQISQDRYGQWFNEAPQVAQPAAVLVPFVNNSGETMPASAVMSCPDSIDLGGVPFILGEKPDQRFFNFYLVNSNTPVNSLGQGLGSFLTDIVGLVRLDEPYTPDPLNDAWGPKPGTWGLHRDRLGFSPLRNGVFTSGSDRFGYFKQREINEVFGKYYSDLNEGESAEFEIYIRQATNGNRILPGGWNKITVWDYWLQKDQVVKTGTKGKATFYSSYWEADLTHCEVSNTDDNYPSGQRAAGMAFNNDLALVLSQPSTQSQSAAVLPLAMGLPYGHPI